MSYEYKPHTWVPKEIISADKMNELEKAAEQVGKLKPVSETGSYNDLTDKPQINGNELSSDMSTTDLGLHTVAQSGKYDELVGRPQINGTTLTGNKTTTQIGLHTVAESGSYNDLDDKPQIAGYELSGNMTADALGFSTVATSGAYTDLSAKPQINGVELSGNKMAADLNFAAVSTSGEYSDLTGVPTNVSQFTNDANYQTESDVTTKIANANHLKRQVVTVLPEVTSADANTIYMVKMSSGSTDEDVYTEYMVIDDKWERLGTSRADLTEYMKTTDINAALAGKVSTTTTVNGYALSSNVTLTAADVKAVPTTTTVNGHALSSNVTIAYADISDAPQPMTEEEIRAIFK